MTWSNAGFPETVADGADWHRVMGLAAGRQDAFPYVSHLRPEARPGLVTRVSAGEMVSGGVWSYSNADIDMDALPALGSGQKYHLLVTRKVYGATAAEHVTSLEYIEGDSNRVIPAFQQVKGEIWETPIALCKVKSGKSTLDELVDLRVIAETNGVYTIYDDLALQLIDRPGAVVYNPNTGVTQARVYNATLGRTWLPLLTRPQALKVIQDNNPGTARDNWYEDGEWCQARTTEGDPAVQLQVMLRHNAGGAIVASGAGSFPDTHIFTVRDAYKPLDQVVGQGYYYSASRSTYGCLVTLETDGKVYLRAGAPGIDLPQISGQSNIGKPSIRASFYYMAKG